jgi:LacI family transcriptional regulator
MYDVARRAHVSQTTVSFVLNGTPNVRIPTATRERVWDAVRELGYRPNAVAQGLRLGGSQLIGFVADAIATTPFAGAIIRGAQDAAWAQGCLLLVVSTEGDPAMEESAIQTMLEHRVRGIVYSTWYHHAVAPPTSIHEAPSILINCFVMDGSLPSVVPDELQGGLSATEILLKAGHRRVAMLNSVPLSQEASAAMAAAAGASRPGAASLSEVPAPATVLRRDGFRSALESAAITFDPSLVVEVEPIQEGGYQGTAWLLDRPPAERPTAIFAYNDRVAMGAYDAARERGLRIPDDVAIVGFDNQEVIAAHLRPPLSTVALPHYELGWWGVNHLLSSLGKRGKGQPVQHRIACPYVERASV